MVSLSVRAFAELLHLPAYEQLRILYEQKYPKQQPQVFKVPYYLVALSGIRQYYRLRNDRHALAEARTRATGLALKPRQSSNLRVISAFEASSQARRALRPNPLEALRAQPYAGVELKLQFDLQAEEQGRPVRIFYNPRGAPIEPDVARNTLQIAHWVLDENEMGLPFRSLEYVDLVGNRVYAISRQSQRTIRLMRSNARIIATLWPTL